MRSSMVTWPSFVVLAFSHTSHTSLNHIIEAIKAVLWIWNDLFRIRIRIQLWIFRVPDPDPDPGKSSGSMRIRIHNTAKHPLNSIKKKNLNNYLPFSIQYYYPILQTVQNSQFYWSAPSLFAGSGSGTIIPDPCGSESGSTTLHKSQAKPFINHTIVSMKVKQSIS